MMSGQAFNALLKTLEEPPTYVIFILATTEYNKLPTTIVSRCQRFDFKRIATDVIVSRLLKMSKTEDIDITEDAARVIARISRGGMRDAISLLELCSGAHTKIDESLVFATVGSGNRESAYKIVDAICKSDFETVYSVINDIVIKSGDLSVFWQEIIDSYRDIMVVKNAENAKRYLDLTDNEYNQLSKMAEGFTMAKLSYHVSLLEGAMADMQRAVNSKRSIAEIALTRMCDPKLSASAESMAVRIEELEKSVRMMKLGVPASTVQQPSAEVEKTESPMPEKATTAQVDNKSGELVIYKGWGHVIEKISEVKMSLSSGIASASVYTDNDCSFYIKANDFFAQRLRSNETDMAILRGVIAECTGKNVADIKIYVESLQNKTPDAFLEIEKALK